MNIMANVRSSKRGRGHNHFLMPLCLLSSNNSFPGLPSEEEAIWLPESLMQLANLAHSLLLSNRAEGALWCARKARPK